MLLWILSSLFYYPFEELFKENALSQTKNKQYIMDIGFSQQKINMPWLEILYQMSSEATLKFGWSHLKDSMDSLQLQEQ